MNLRPSGYEPDELPGCSTPRHLSSPETDTKQANGPLKVVPYWTMRRVMRPIGIDTGRLIAGLARL